LSLQITKIKGIPIRLHFTLIIVFFLIVWTLSGSLMPEIHPGLSRRDYWIIGIFGACTSFISILLHELAHSIVALRYGLKVRQIVLFIFGGVSDIEEGESSKDFHKEFKIAIVGPITSFVIAAVLGLSWWILISVAQTGEPSSAANNNVITIIEAILQYGAIINTMLGGFNLVPAFPLDGGRILRSALLRWKKDYDQSTKIAVRIGTAISYVFMAIGFIIMLSGSFIGGMWLLFIGWFLNSGAQSYLEQHQLSTALSGVYLKDIMNTRYISVKPDITVNELLNNYFNVYRKSEFPVVVEGENAMGNELLGAVTAKQALKVPEHSRNRIKVEEIMAPKDELIVMRSNRPADYALRRMFRENKSRVFICEKDKEEEQEVKQYRRQKLIGLISKTDILNIAKEREEFDKAIEKLSVSSSSNDDDVATDNSNFGKTIITSSSATSPCSYPSSYDKNNKFNIISRWRFLFFVVGIIVFIIAYFVGATLVNLNPGQTDFIKRDFEKKIKGINQYGIFANNVRVALGMFIPGFGIALGTFSAFSTGLVFNALSTISPALSNISPLIVFLTPFGILEIIAYGIAISRSGILSYQLIKDTNKRQSWRKYVIPTVIEIGIVVIILFIGAIVEWQLIHTLGI
jgi:Zn-dependent protease